MLVALSPAAAAGCSADRPRGTIVGILTLERPWRHGMLFNSPSPGRINLLLHGKIVATVTADSDGDFRARVPAGRYMLRGFTPASKPCASRPAMVTVTAGHASHVDLLCRTRREFPR